MNAGGTQFYYVRCDLAAQKIHFGKRAAGVNTDIATFDATVALNTWMRIRVIYTANEVRIYIAGKTSQAWDFLGYATDSTFTSGQTGFFAITGGAGLFTDFICADSTGLFLDYNAADLPLLGYWNAEGVKF